MKQIRIFISSPGDVAEERDKARLVIRHLQKRYAGRFALVSVLWEDLPLTSGMSFQEGIDMILSEKGVDIAVFILWSRLGSPVGTTVLKADQSEYRSGTEREFDLMMQALRNSKERTGRRRPEILVYVRKDDTAFSQSLFHKSSSQIKEMGEQKELIESFVHEQFHDAERGFNISAYHSFDLPMTFGHKLQIHLQGLLDTLAGEENLTSATWNEAPYRGLKVFDTEHADIFYGREREVSELILTLHEQQRHGCGFVLVAGASGSGKSSLIRAGVIPALTKGELESDAALWRYGVMTPGEKPDNLMLNLVRCLCNTNALPHLTASGEEMQALVDGLIKAPEVTWNVSIRKALTGYRGERREAKLLIVIDQLEELFTHGGDDPKQQNAFFAALRVLTSTGQVGVIASVRSDFYDRCQRIPDMVAMKSGHGLFDLLPPDPAAIHRIINYPARLSGIRFEKDTKTGERLDQRLLNDALRHPEALPLLEYTLRELYETGENDPDRVLKFQEYNALGGVEGALGKRAEAVFSELSDRARMALPAVLNDLVTVSEKEDAVSVRRRARLADVTDTAEKEELVHRFIAERLFIGDRDAEGALVYVAHEALLKNWERVVQWTAENKDFLHIRSRVSRASQRWQAEEKNTDFLLQAGKPLAEAEALLASHRSKLKPSLIVFIETSVKQMNMKEKGRLRRLQMTSVLFCLLAVAAAIAWGFAISNKHRADRAATQAFEAQTLAEQKQQEAQYSEARAKDELERAVKAEKRLKTEIKKTQAEQYRTNVVLARYRIAENNFKDARRLLESCAPANRHWEWGYLMELCHDELETWHGHSAAVTHVTVSPDGKYVLSASEDHTLKLWSLDSGKEVAAFIGHQGPVRTAAFFPDGKRIASAGDDKQIRIWDITSAREVSVLNGHDESLESILKLCISPDASRLVSVDSSYSDPVRIWDLNKEEELINIKISGPVQTVDISPNGEYLTTAEYGGVYVREFLTGKVLVEFSQLLGQLNAVPYSHKGKQLIAGGEDKVIRVWDTKEKKLLRTLKGHIGSISDLGLSPDGKRIFSTSNDTTIRVWNLESGKELSILKGHTGAVQCAAFCKENKIVSGGADSTLKVWNELPGQDFLDPIDKTLDRISDYRPDNLVIHPDNVHIVAANWDGQLHVWNTQTQKIVKDFGTIQDGIDAVAVSFDGKLVASGGYKKIGSYNYMYNVLVWDFETNELLAEFKDDDFEFMNLDFSPDGKKLCAASSFTMRVWDIEQAKELIWFSEYDERVQVIRFLPDGKKIVCAGDDKILILNAENGEKLASLTGHDAQINALEVYDNRIVSCSDDQTIKIWDSDSEQELLTLQGHLGKVTSLDISPDGKRVVSVAEDSTLRVWDMETGNELVTLSGHENIPRKVHFSNDGYRIFSIDSKYKVNAWDGYDPIWQYAAGQGDLSCLRQALKSRENITALVDRQGDTLLHMAATSHREDIVREVLKAGLSVQKVNFKGETPVMVAARAGDPAVLSALLEHKPDLETKNYEGKTAFMLAVEAQAFVTADLLYRKEANIFGKMKDDMGETPLIMAVDLEEVHITKFLLQNGADPDRTNEEGSTALISAIDAGNMQLTRLLLESGADPNLTDHNGYSPFMSIFEESIEFVNLLLRYGAKPEMQNRYGSTAAVYFAWNGDYKYLPLLFDVKKFDLELIRARAKKDPDYAQKHLLDGIATAGTIAKAEGDKTKAQVLFKEGLRLAETGNALLWEVFFRDQLYVFAFKDKLYLECLKHYQRIVAVRRQLYKSEPEIMKQPFCDELSRKAYLLQLNGRFDESLKAALEAQELFPIKKANWQAGHLAFAYMFTGQWDKANALFKKLFIGQQLYDQLTGNELLISWIKDFKQAGIEHPALDKLQELVDSFEAAENPKQN